MTNYSFAQLERIWINGGGSPVQAPLMAAIALAESSGNPNAVNATDNNGTQSSYGLWQISNGTHAAPAANWADPTANARLAVGKLKSQGLGAWGTYTSGVYKKYLQGGVGPASSVPGSTAGTGTTLAAATSGTTSATCLIPNPSVSVPVVGQLGGGCLVSKPEGRAVLGGVLIANGALVLVIGLAFLAVFGIASTRVGKAATGVAAKVMK